MAALREHLRGLDQDGGGVITRAEFANRSRPGVFDGVVVDARQRWTETGILLRRGDTVRIEADGVVRLSGSESDEAVPAGARSGQQAALRRRSQLGLPVRSSREWETPRRYSSARTRRSALRWTVSSCSASTTIISTTTRVSSGSGLERERQSITGLLRNAQIERRHLGGVPLRAGQSRH